MHELDPDDPEYKPASQGVHDEAPVPEYWPATQLTHAVTPAAAEY